MAQQIEFSIMADTEAGLRPLLDAFETEQNIHVRVKLLSWDTAWSELVKTAIYGDGPDLSEVGNTWTGDLIGMNALRPFNAAEITAFGKAASFLPSAWRMGSMGNGSPEWSIPWLAGARLIYYRPALLEKAGVDPEQAFHSIGAFGQTVERLKAAGVKYPWIVPTRLTHTTLLIVSSWVWAAGGDFLTRDGRSTCFLEPMAQEGLRAYYRLGRFLAPEVSRLDGTEPDNVFLRDPQAAVIYSGPWLRRRCEEAGLLGEVRALPPPGPSFVGGSNLVIWKHSAQADAAVKLVRFLTQTESQLSYSQSAGLLPVRLEALEGETYQSDAYWRVAVECLSRGRSFPVMRLWGLVEDRLSSAFAGVWSDLLGDPALDPAAPLQKYLGPLARRLDEILKQ